MAADQQGGAPRPAAVADPKYAWPKTSSVLGASTKRVDGPEKVTGNARYTFDIKRPGMLYARLVRSPYPHARVRSIDFTAARSAPGVRAVLSVKDLANPQNTELMFQGDEIAAIAADTEAQAIDAARLIKIDFEQLPHVINIDEALAGTAPAVFPGGNIRPGRPQAAGDIEAGFRTAVHTFEQTYSTHVITHVCLETHGTVCEWDGDKLTAWVSTQGVNSARENFATSLGIPLTSVRVLCDYMGGGFGAKAFSVGAEGLMCAKLAKAAGRPVKLMCDRKEEHLATGNRPSAFAKIRAGVSAEGKIVAVDAETWGSGGAGAGADFPLPYIYQIPNRRRSHRDVYTNTGQQRPMRAPSHPQASFMTELMMDEAADLAKVDPVEFRLRHLPPEAPNAMWAAYLKEGAADFGWAKRHATGDPAPGPIKRGMGVALGTWGGGGRGPAQAHCEIGADGSVAMRIASQDLGTGTRTLVAVVAADALGLQPTQISAQIGDTNFGVSPLSGGSVTAASISPAIRVTAIKALDALYAKVAPSLGVAADALAAADGRVFVKADPSKGLAWRDACKLIGPQPISADGDWVPGMSSSTASAVQFVEATVDIETGIVRVTRILAIQDCGKVISRLTAESQCYGGVIGSLNFALFEDRILDKHTGQMVNPDMESYLLAGMSDIPPIEIRLKDQPERGVIGVAEPPTIPTSSAIALAVRNAIGVTVRRLPLTPAVILQSLRQRT